MLELPEKLRKALSDCNTLPSAPAAMLEIMELCNSEDISIAAAAKILSRDPALSAKTLTVANSPLFGTSTRIASVDRAVSLLGINATLSFALSYLLVRDVRIGQKSTFDHEAFWRRSAIAAVSARSIGSLAQNTSSEELFLAGLLQDIGMLALNEAIPGLYRDLTASGRWDHRDIIEVERKATGVDHSVVSAWMLQRWNLPEKLWLAAAGSHDPEITGDREPRFVQAAALASAIAEIWMRQENGEATTAAAHLSERYFKMSPNAFEEMLHAIAKALPDATRSLDIDLGDEERFFQLLDQAREVLLMSTLRMQQEARFLENKSHTDPLTSLNNRAYLDETLPGLFERSQQSGQPLSLVFSDLDHFKRINDTYGHGAGDQVLVSVAGMMQSVLRDNDIVARYGGEEFVCLLPGADEAGAARVAERLRKLVESQAISLEDGRCVNVTISAGCATASERSTFSSFREFLSAADRCLYEAKNAGRNRVVSLGPAGVQSS
jgi:diguanylate cyclase (GGDEF)-like protein